ncbi:aspartyl-phosphate phosphatase Spo0E family protein [Butyricicoccus sp. 1XD8-22]|nr:aspartyl-phosphate phosphatase Spo0E family protein [Butyricicoccus sp. 1XD8-22]
MLVNYLAHDIDEGTSSKGEVATTIKRLENKMSILKSKMISNGLSKGLTHPDTIKYSQELDRVMNCYTKLKHHKQISLL